MQSDRYDLLELSGQPRSRGKKYGEARRNEIQHLIDYLYSLLKLEKREILNHVKKHTPFIDYYSPEIAEELQGIAEGAEREYEEIVMIAMHEEHAAVKSHGCTTFATAAEMSLDNRTYIGQTWDIDKELCENAGALMLKVRRENGPDFLSYAYSGMIAGAGINENGISLVWNSLPRLQINPGVSTYIIIEEILRQKTIGGALAAISRAERAGCFNFVLADETEIYNIEATPDDIDISYSTDYIGHTNHFVADKFKNKQNMNEMAGKTSASSIVRYNRINRLLAQKKGKLDWDGIVELMSDHVNYPHSICRHAGQIEEAEGPILTCATFIMIPEKREFWIAGGPACENSFQKYSV
ncbi:MAG: C45 family autoproteolytic acyltransferase/hydrolase [Halanaerobiales bacterium]